ncbi:protein FAM161A-like [Haliotis cracherodii]|uniref:protein FAM161A-like n=1 Tax=Haliotis cracherodii TaxID=6455 RepID=UPI0039EB71F0
MATMATSHGLSVLTNSCIKPPVNPDSGLSSTYDNRPEAYYRYHENVDNAEINEYELQNRNGGNVGHILANVPLDDVASHLQLLSDDEFYDRLLTLKEEQKKTLQRCEEMYRQKLSREQGLTTQDAVDDIFHRNEVRQTVNGHVSDSEDSQAFAGFSHSHHIDQVRDMTKKPPISPLVKHALRQGAVMSQTLPVRSRVFKERPSSAPAAGRHYSRSLDGDDWQEDQQQSAYESGNEELLEKSQNKSSEELSAALSRIDDMWDNFSIEDYVTRERRHSSASLVKQKKSNRPEDNWRHRLTIPQPFKMTLRDEIKEKKKTSAQIEVELKRLEREKQDEAECQKKFKASPAPAHIYLPLYDEIQEKNEARRRYVREYCTEMLKSQEKPFNFMTREEEKKKCKPTPAPVVKPVKEKPVFKAKPVPEYLYDNTVNEKLMEEEEYRRIRIQMRSEELLRESALPPNMAARQMMKEEKLKAKALKSKRRHFKPKINRYVPDYDALFNQFQRELARRKRQRDATVMKPFDLETERIPSRKERILREIERDEELRRENRWPYRSGRMTPRSAGILSTSLDSIPAKTTHSSQLRESVTRDHRQKLTQQEQEELEEERRRRIRGMRIRKTISERSSVDSARGRRETVSDRLKRIREEERSRQEEYDRELQKIQEKVQQRPLLFERQSQVNARKAAEKKFSNTLRSVGLDEDFLHSRSSATHSRSSVTHSQVVDGDNYDDDSFDDTALKSTEMDDE